MSSPAQQAPAVPPRPSRSQVKADTPPVPPRPAGRSKSPNPERFPQSPLNDSLLAKNKTLRFEEAEPPERPKSVVMPSVGEEGMEYSVIPDELEKRTVGDDVKLAAPEPRLPTATAKDRVSTVTRTDSDRAASFGIGKPGSQTPSLKKKASTISQNSGTDMPDDKEGIPEIGQRIPLLAHVGDVQAPSPAPGLTDGFKPRHHSRKASARGFADLPEDTYGLRGHGKAPKDQLDKEYYQKHPEIVQREKQLQRHEHDRASDFAMTSDELNKLVRETAAPAEDEHEGIPSESIVYEAHVEYAARMSRPTSTVPTKIDEPKEESQAIHVEHDNRGEVAAPRGTEDPYKAPILAADEVARDPQAYEQAPAVAPPPERSGSAFEIEEPRSKPTSRPSSMYVPPIEVQPTPLEDVQEYEPLFPEDEKEVKPAEPQEVPQPRFPSKDVWEDAPNSVHVTAEVSEPQPPPPEDAETPTEERKLDSTERAQTPQATQEQSEPRSWVEKQLKMSDGTPQEAQQKFPSQDVWEDTPDSLKLETTVSAPQTAEEESSPVEATKPLNPARPAKKATEDCVTEAQKPVVPERPKAKPAIPGKPKPVVPGLPVGGKIAALQAGFMADLNKRLQVGPMAPKKEELVAKDLTEDKDKAPLSDARKSRARGPQRRAPGAGKSPAPAAVNEPSLSFSTPRTMWSIGPEDGSLSINGEAEGIEEEPQTVTTTTEPVAEVKTESLEADMA